MKQKPIFETWPIERLHGYTKNPRIHKPQDIDKTAAFIDRFGFKGAIVARSTGEVIDGHLRLKALQKLGWREVPVVLGDEWTPEEVRAFRLGINRSAEWAEWDEELLRLELAELDDAGFDLSVIDLELEPLPPSMVAGLADADAVPAVQKESVSREGDVWLMGKHRLMCGSCTDAEAVAALMNGKKADVVATDPPYGLGDTNSEKNNYDVYDDTLDNLQKLIAEFLPIAQNIAPVVVLTPGNGNQWFYPKPTWCMAWFCPAGVGRGVWGFTCWQPILCYGKDPKLSKGKGSHPDAIVHQEGAGVDWHPCAKPVKFWLWLLERVSEPGALFYEPFSGSGTTIITCEMSSRICYAIELSPHYVDCAVQRWQDFTGQEATLEATGRTFKETAADRGVKV